EDFVLLKLLREEPQEGLFLLRWSSLDFHRLILAVINRPKNQAPEKFNFYEFQT
ncbi:hypothetical protein HGM15179_021150, partial [Zosterops borbonicus]